MIKYATALRLGTAETEAILKRFIRNNLKHPTYLAFAELGKAIKTIFLSRYLHSEALRREIQEGLNVIETWNGANSFILYGKGGEIATNDLENQELAMLALHDPACPNRARLDATHAPRRSTCTDAAYLLSRDSLWDFSPRHESEAGDRTRCGCCVMLRAALLCPW